MEKKFILLLSVLLLNILVLDYKMLKSGQPPKDQPNESGFTVVSVASKSAGKRGETIDSCYPHSCIDLIREATASVLEKVSVKEKPVTGVPGSSVKEFYIPLGSGQTQSEQYEDVPGLSAYIDSTSYSKIKKVTFEASMRITNAHGRVYAQLFNDTDKHPVWFSEISMEGDKSQLLISAPIILDKGNKLYKVQMKTTLKEVSYIDQARVHILTE